MERGRNVTVEQDYWTTRGYLRSIKIFSERCGNYPKLSRNRRSKIVGDNQTIWNQPQIYVGISEKAGARSNQCWSNAYNPISIPNERRDEIMGTKNIPSKKKLVGSEINGISSSFGTMAWPLENREEFEQHCPQGTRSYANKFR